MTNIGRRDLLIAGASTGALALSGCTDKGTNRGTAEGVDEPDRPEAPAGPWARVHLQNGVDGWTCVPVNGTQTDPVGGAYARSIDPVGRLRFTSSAANSEESRREVWVTGEPVTDVEARVLIAPPSAMNPTVATPQMGLALRVSAPENGKRSAFVFDTNIFSGNFEQMWCALWEWPDPVEPSGLTIAGQSESIPLFQYSVPIRCVQRIAGSPSLDLLTVDPGPLPVAKFADGDRVTIAKTFDASYRQSDAEVVAARGQDYGGVEGPVVLVKNAAQAQSSPAALDAGHLQYASPGPKAIDPRALYPLHVAARVIGSVAQLKAWPTNAVEPPWSSSLHAVTVDFSHVTDVKVPEAGQVGLIVNHLHGADQFVAYGDLEVTPL